ncbi:MAG: carboxypeptidase-like regulatory domain-containing protein, partial [Bacteroidales bacterium]
MKDVRKMSRSMLKGVIAANLLLSLSFPLNAQNNKEVSIKLKEGNLEQVLSEIQKQTGSHFFYDDAMAKMKLNNIDVSSLPLSKALDQILIKLGVTYKIEDNIVYLQKGNQKSKSTKNIKGVVIDEKGEPLMGVNVFVSGTQNGTVTDLDGNYQLSDVPSNGEISFSYIGYKQEALPVSKSDVLNATLREDTKLLNDVVVTALGIKREKKVLGYSVQEVKSDDLTATGDASITSALQGKVAGLQINNASTGLGGSSKITIRGNSSLTDNNQPLWIVDGVPFNDNSSSGASLYGGIDRGSTSFDINPDDIESISVLKG